MKLGKMKFTPALAAIAGGIASELGMKFLPVGGKYNPAIFAGVGFLAMQGKGDMMQYGGAGMLGNSGAALVGNFVPSLKAVSDNTLDEVYNDIKNARQIEGGGNMVLMGLDEFGNEIYEADGNPYAPALSGNVLMGTSEKDIY